jgi:hypothetical protein
MTAARLRELRLCGLVDSFGLSLGWTVFVLLAVRNGGLPEAAAYNAAMLVGIVLSAPVTGWLTTHLNGGPLLRTVSVTEAVLRLATIAGLLAGAPTPLVAAGVAVMFLAGYTGYAVMRAEVAAVDPTPAAMTGYVTVIAAIEAVGAGAAAMLPGDSVPSCVIATYVLSLLPTYLSARRSRVVMTRRDYRARLPVGALCGGAGVAMLATGPTLLAVALAAELHGQMWVAGAAAAFTVGCLCSSGAVTAVGRLRLPETVGWPLWGVGMLAGWTVAAWHPVALLAAQFMAGLCMTAFEGEMDSRIAERTGASAATRVLAWAASTRALGSALAVRLLPVVVTAQTVGYAAGAGTAALVVCGVLVGAGFQAGVRSTRVSPSSGRPAPASVGSAGASAVGPGSVGASAARPGSAARPAPALPPPVSPAPAWIPSAPPPPARSASVWPPPAPPPPAWVPSAPPAPARSAAVWPHPVSPAPAWSPSAPPTPAAPTPARPASDRPRAAFPDSAQPALAWSESVEPGWSQPVGPHRREAPAGGLPDQVRT